MLEPSQGAENVEYKTRLASFDAVEARLRRLGATFAGTLGQRDTYFAVPSGRLKLREQGDGAELIAYQREEDAPSMHSRYTLTAVTDPPAAIAALTDKHSVRGVVVKARRLWHFENARVHLDTVDGLGTFLEIEVVAPETVDAGRATLTRLQGALDLDAAAAIRRSYIDLLTE